MKENISMRWLLQYGIKRVNMLKLQINQTKSESQTQVLLQN